MSKHGTIRRYTLEIEKIRYGQLPSFDTIKEYLHEHGFEVSERTIQRDIEHIRDEFGIEIQYNRYENGYFIDYENSLNIESFFRFLEIVNTAELLTESLYESKNALKHISFDTGGGLKGIENLKPLLNAIKDKRKLSFNHYNFYTGITKKHLLNPYMLKEYRKRWYVVGITGEEKLRTFGIDRISDLVVQSNVFIRDKNVNPEEMFDKTIGIVYSYNEQQQVILSFTPNQGKYIKTLPLHKSQQILVDNETELRISLNIIPNYEFNQIILMHGETVTVIEPQWLISQIKQKLTETLAKYK